MPDSKKLNAPLDPALAEAETKVICPVCKQGMVPHHVAKVVSEALKMLDDGPSGMLPEVPSTPPGASDP